MRMVYLKNFEINTTFEKGLNGFMNAVQFFIVHAQFQANKKILHDPIRETVWTVLPSLILWLLAIPSLWVLYSLDQIDDSMPAVLIKVVGHQWYWSYEYSGDFLSIFCNTENNHNFFVDEDAYLQIDENFNTSFSHLLETDKVIFFPILTNIRVLITSADVLHSWAVPSLGVKIDAVPGRLNSIFIFLKREGHFFGQCSEICGVNHGFMPISIYGTVGLNLNNELWLKNYYEF